VDVPTGVGEGQSQQHPAAESRPPRTRRPRSARRSRRVRPAPSGAGGRCSRAVRGVQRALRHSGLWPDVGRRLAV